MMMICCVNNAISKHICFLTHLLIFLIVMLLCIVVLIKFKKKKIRTLDV